MHLLGSTLLRSLICRSSALDSAPAVAVLPPVVQPALPRRGDPTADHGKHADFLRTGHIRFAESDGEAPAEESEVRYPMIKFKSKPSDHLNLHKSQLSQQPAFVLKAGLSAACGLLLAILLDSCW